MSSQENRISLVFWVRYDCHTGRGTFHAFGAAPVSNLEKKIQYRVSVKNENDSNYHTYPDGTNPLPVREAMDFYRSKSQAGQRLSGDMFLVEVFDAEGHKLFGISKEKRKEFPPDSDAIYHRTNVVYDITSQKVIDTSTGDELHPVQR